MKTTINSLVFIALLGFVVGASADSYFDGTKPLICTVHQLYECDPPNDCQPVTPDEIDAATHLDVDFKKKVVTRAGVDSPQKSPIESIETRVDGKLIIQGIEDGQEGVRDGAGWTISIMDPEGTMVLAAAADGFAVVGLGACAPKP